MEKGQVIRARTNAELLNTLLGTHYKQWMKSVYKYGNDAYIWMVKFDDKLRAGWRNRFSNGDIIEELVDRSVTEWNRIPLEDMDKMRRYVFERREGYYIFHGIYVIDLTRSNLTDISKPRMRYLRLLSRC